MSAEEYVLIEAGVIEKSTLSHEVGQHRFWVSVIDEHGQMILWDGSSHVLAKQQAEEISHDWDGIEIVDRTEGRTLQ